MLDATYTLNWLRNNEFLDNDLIHMVGLGLGLRFD